MIITTPVRPNTSHANKLIVTSIVRSPLQYGHSCSVPNYVPQCKESTFNLGNTVTSKVRSCSLIYAETVAIPFDSLTIGFHRRHHDTRGDNLPGIGDTPGGGRLGVPGR